jgi:phospholipase/carboxylesterase
MNRIQPRSQTANSAVEQSSPAGSSISVEAGVLRSTISNPHYAIFGPLHYEANYAYPVVIWLHGPDDNENQLKRVMPQISLRNYVALAPRGTALGSQDLPSAYRWLQTEEHILAAERRVLECLSIAREKFNIAGERVFLAGYDCGGTMAYRVAMRHPRLFAGVLSCGGAFPSGHAPLSQLHEARRLAIFVACNRAARRYPTAAVCEDLRLMHAAGMSIVLREYPGDDGLTPQMLADMDRWIMEQVTAPACDATCPSPSAPK